MHVTAQTTLQEAAFPQAFSAADPMPAAGHSALLPMKEASMERVRF